MKNTYKGSWEVSNTWSDKAYTAKTEKGLLRILGKIIDGNKTSPNDTGSATIWRSEDACEDPVNKYYRAKGRWAKSTEESY
mgnify:CR=1 FL=1